jgi:hypothetical protein
MADVVVEGTAAATIEEDQESTITSFFPELRDKSLIFQGDADCIPKSVELFVAMGLPKGLLPLKNIVETGWHEESGFSWTITSGEQQHYFEAADRQCAYDEIVTATITPGRMSNINGVKAKELGFFVPVNEISVVDAPDPADKKLVFTSLLGLSRTMPFHLFDE